jgi:anti-sigma regulatory factor (Ser/Thr protein kinase)
VDATLLLTSELVTNALRYGNGNGGICLTVRQTPHVLRVEVHDANPAAPKPSRLFGGEVSAGLDRRSVAGVDRGVNRLDVALELGSILA